MLSTRFKTGIVGSNEVYVFQKAGHKRLSTQTIPFPNSLITFLYMATATATPLLQKATDALSVLIQTHDTKVLSPVGKTVKLIQSPSKSIAENTRGALPGSNQGGLNRRSSTHGARYPERNVLTAKPEKYRWKNFRLG